MRDLPPAVRAKARDAGAQAWLDDLPRLVGDLCDRWKLRPGGAFGDATEAYVMKVTRGDGTPAVLKLVVPRDGAAAAHEITVLRLAAGEGCGRLYEFDESRGALLLERLGPAMSDLGLPQPERLAILTGLASALWRRVTPDALAAAATLPTGLAKAEHLARYIPAKWTELGEPCPRRVADQAVAAARSRARAWDPGRAVLAHGDVHQWNALRVIDEGPLSRSCQEGRPGVRHFSGPAAPPAEETLGLTAGARGHTGRFKLVDPDGIVAEPEYDLGVLMREDPVELMAGDPWERALRLAAWTGTDPMAIWEWGLAERVSTGLVLTVAGVQPVARQMLAAADEISRRS